MPSPESADLAATDPRGDGIVTFRQINSAITERQIKYPDGSTDIEMLGDWNVAMAASRGALSGGPEVARGIATGADAAARRLAETAAGRLLYCPDSRAWFAWDGAIWRRGAVVAQRMIRATLRDAGVADPGPRLVAAVETFARSEPALAGAGWDADPWRLGTPGGTVDLATGQLHPADPGHRITRATGVTPAPTADCPLWLAFLDETTLGGAALARFLQRYLGYALTGETREHALVYGIGDGGNGKSVFVNIARAILGDHAVVAAPDLFARRAGPGNARSAHSTEIAMLAGARLVTASETEEGRVWADGLLKLLTGGDPITARLLGRDPFTFTPRFKLLVVGNHMPVLRTVDAALRRRLCVVPFAARPAMPDRTLEARLRAEAPAILRWMIDGCLDWRDNGLGRPASVLEATETYLTGQDVFGQFLADACETGPAHEETATSLYAAWCAHARAAGEPPGTARLFGAMLERRGMTRWRTAKARVYRGVRLRG